MKSRIAKVPRVFRDMGRVLSGRIAASLLRLGMTVLLARALEPVQYGLVALLLNGGLLLSSVLEMGLGAAFIERESLSGRAQHAQSRFLQLLRGRLWLWLAFLLVASLALLGPVPARSLVLAVVVFGTGQNLCVSIQLLYQVREDFSGYARVSVVFAGAQVVWSGLLLVTYRAFHLPFDAFLAGMAVLGWMPLFILLRYSGIRCRELLRRNWKADLGYLKQLLRFGKWVGLTTIVTQTFSRYAVMLLGAVEAVAEAGRYDVAMTVGRAVNNIVISTTAVLYPRFAQQKQAEDVRRSIRQVLKAAGSAVGLALISYYLLGRWLVLWLFGPNFRASVTYLDILIPGLLLPILLEPLVGVVTFSMGRPNWVSALRSGKLALFLIFGGFVLRRVGVDGLALLQSTLMVMETGVALVLALARCRWHRT